MPNWPSGHALGISMVVYSASNGATLIEKHFIFSREERGVDSKFSQDPNELNLLVDESGPVWQTQGKLFYRLTSSGHESIKCRRSICVSGEINKGELFSINNIQFVRPDYGAPPSLHNFVLGKLETKNFKAGFSASTERSFLTS